LNNFNRIKLGYFKVFKTRGFKINNWSTGVSKNLMPFFAKQNNVPLFGSFGLA